MDNPHAEGFRVSLIPLRNDADPTSTSATPAREIATLKTKTSRDGTFLLANVRPDQYELRVEGRRIAPTSRMLTVFKTDLDLGSIRVRGTGKVVGKIYHPPHENDEGKAWAFAHGEVFFGSER